MPCNIITMSSVGVKRFCRFPRWKFIRARFFGGEVPLKTVQLMPLLWTLLWCLRQNAIEQDLRHIKVHLHMLLQGPQETLQAHFMTFASTLLCSFTWLLNKNGKAHTEHWWENPVLYCIFRWNDVTSEKDKEKNHHTIGSYINFTCFQTSFQWIPITVLATVLQYCKVMFKLTDSFCNFLFFLWWTDRLDLCANDLPHTVQLYGFSPVWTLICRLSSNLC
jgi:hypothetical protein